MNELDSELVQGQLSALGYQFVSRATDADVILYNTCSVRQQAENKVLSRLGVLGLEIDEGREVVVGVIGCMAEREGASLMTRFPHVNLMCGPGELDRLPRLLDNAAKTSAVQRTDCIALQGGNSRRSSTLTAAEDNLEMLDLSRAFDPDRASSGGRSAYVRITRGCNKFCTYCVVPYTRGAEVHRPPDAIVDECRMLADRGVIEVTLLGQTVNHYHYSHGMSVTVNGAESAQVGPGAKAFRPDGATVTGSRRVTTFADLLERIHEEVPAIQRLRFVTSYPRDFGDDILEVMARSPRICRYLHVPAQSGSNRMLKAMNRGYTIEQYLEFIDRVRHHLPDASIAGDMIVGFPGETDADFAQSRNLLRRVRFKNNFIFKYSPRPGTAAFDRLPDDVPEVVKRRRNNDLLEVQGEISAEVHAEHIGRTEPVFVVQVSEKTRARNGNVEIGWGTARIQMSGRTPGDLICVFDLPPDRVPDDVIGTIVPVTITGSGALLLSGRMNVPSPAAISD